MPFAVTMADLAVRPAGAHPIDWAELLLAKAGAHYRDIGSDLDGFPLVHRFTPGMYAREIFMPSGSVVVSCVHKTEHPYVISQGLVSVWSETLGIEHLKAPYTGITKGGTRRILFVHEDTVWTTFHATDLTDVAEIEHTILEPHTNPLLLQAWHA